MKNERIVDDNSINWNVKCDDIDADEATFPINLQQINPID